MTLAITLTLDDTTELAALAFALDMAFVMEDARYDDELNERFSPASRKEIDETYQRLMALRRLVVRITGNVNYDHPRKPEEFRNKARATAPRAAPPASDGD